MTQAGLGLRLKQQLTLTPRLQQSVKLLQLSALECVQELNQAIAQNPFLEEPAEAADRSQSEEGGSEESSTSSDLDFTSTGVSGGSGGGEDAPDWTEWTASPSTLHDSLREQLLLLGLGERDYALAHLVVDALDEDGFLRQPLDELVSFADALEPGELETALRIVQTLEPAGHSNLEEALKFTRATRRDRGLIVVLSDFLNVTLQKWHLFLILPLSFRDRGRASGNRGHP